MGAIIPFVLGVKENKMRQTSAEYSHACSRCLDGWPFCLSVRWMLAFVFFDTFYQIKIYQKVNIGAERGKSNNKSVGGDQKGGRKGEGKKLMGS